MCVVNSLLWHSQQQHEQRAHLIVAIKYQYTTDRMTSHTHTHRTPTDLWEKSKRLVSCFIQQSFAYFSILPLHFFPSALHFSSSTSSTCYICHLWLRLHLLLLSLLFSHYIRTHTCTCSLSTLTVLHTRSLLFFPYTMSMGVYIVYIIKIEYK